MNGDKTIFNMDMKYSIYRHFRECGFRGSIMCICKTDIGYTAIVKPSISELVHGENFRFVEGEVNGVQILTIQSLIDLILSRSRVTRFLEYFEQNKNTDDCVQFKFDVGSTTARKLNPHEVSILDFMALLNRERKLSYEAINYLLLIEYGIKSVEMSQFFNLICKEKD